MKYSDFFFSFISQTIHRETSRIPKGVVHFRGCRSFFREKSIFPPLPCYWTINTRNFRSEWGRDGWNELLHRKINAPRVFRPTKHATVVFRHVCISWEVFFFSRVRAWKPCEAKWWKKDRGGEVNKNDFILLENNSHVCEYIVRGYLYRKLINEKRLLIAGLTAI